MLPLQNAWLERAPGGLAMVLLGTGGWEQALVLYSKASSSFSPRL